MMSQRHLLQSIIAAAFTTISIILGVVIVFLFTFLWNQKHQITVSSEPPDKIQQSDDPYRLANSALKEIQSIDLTLKKNWQNMERLVPLLTPLFTADRNMPQGKMAGIQEIFYSYPQWENLEKAFPKWFYEATIAKICIECPMVALNYYSTST